MLAEESSQLGLHFRQGNERVHVGDEEFCDLLDLLRLVGGRFLVVLAAVTAHVK